MQKSAQQFLLENVIWFGGSLILALFIWMIAVSQSDPVEQWRLGQRVPIRAQTDPGVLIVEQSETTAQVQLQGQQSVRQALAVDDVIVTADLTDLPPGTHIIPLTTRVVRQAQVIDTSPRQITVTIEIEEAQLKPVEVVFSAEPPLDYRALEAEYSERQALVSGPLSLVTQVDSVRLELDLSDQRTTFEDDARLIPVDVDGEIIDGVTIDPQMIDVRVVIEARDDVKPMRVLTSTDGDLPQGYLLTSFDYAPQSVYISGPPDVLESIGDTLFTTAIDFSNRTADFRESVPIVLPDPRLVLIPSGNVTVTVGITAQIITRQFDRIPVDVIGLEEGETAQISPDQVTVLITGAQPQLETLRLADIQVVVDVNELAAGESAALTPITSLRSGALTEANIQIIPAGIDVRLIDASASTPEATEAG
jgi:YbbR domain-containing protein